MKLKFYHHALPGAARLGLLIVFAKRGPRHRRGRGLPRFHRRREHIRIIIAVERFKENVQESVADHKVVRDLTHARVSIIHPIAQDRVLGAAGPGNVVDPAAVIPDNIMGMSRDGSRILFLQAVEQPNPQLTYVRTNWDASLRR